VTKPQGTRACAEHEAAGAVVCQNEANAARQCASCRANLIEGSAATGNQDGILSVQLGMDDIEREAIRAEGLAPDDPAVVTAIDLVRWELSMLKGRPARRRAGDLEVGVG
jgi:hypothetical protein